MKKIEIEALMTFPYFCLALWSSILSSSILSSLLFLWRIPFALSNFYKNFYILSQKCTKVNLESNIKVLVLKTYSFRPLHMGGSLFRIVWSCPYSIWESGAFWHANFLSCTFLKTKVIGILRFRAFFLRFRGSFSLRVFMHQLLLKISL